MRVLGLDVAVSPLEIRARVGYMPESDATSPGMNAVSFVRVLRRARGTGARRRDAARAQVLSTWLGEARYRNVEDLLDRHEAADQARAGARARSRSAVLDEPTNGIGPKGRDRCSSSFRELAHNKGVNLILSSHLLPDASTCDAGGRHGQGGRSRGGTMRRSSSRAAASRAACQDADRRAGALPAASTRRRTRLSCDRRGRDARVRAGEGGPRDLFALASAARCRCGTCVRAS